MEFIVDLLALQKALKLLGSVAKQNDDNPDGHLLLDVRNTGELILLATSSNLSITHVIQKCVVKTEGVLAVSYKKLSTFLNAFSYITEGVGSEIVRFKGLKNDLSLSVDGITANNKKIAHKLKLRLENTQKIALPSPFTTTTLEINSATLRLALSKVLYAINPKSIRTFLQGVNLSIDKDFMYFAGTDAQKLSEYKTPNTSSLLEGNYIISYDFFNSLKRIIDDDSPVYFYIDNSKIKARIYNTVLHGLLLVGESYPNYQKVFQNFKHTIVLNKDELLLSLAPILPSLDKEDLNRLTITIDNRRLLFKSDWAEAEYSSEVDFEGNFTIDLNGSYLVHTLTAIMDDMVTIQLQDDVSPVIFDSARFSNQKALITPIRRR